MSTQWNQQHTKIVFLKVIDVWENQTFEWINVQKQPNYLGTQKMNRESLKSLKSIKVLKIQRWKYYSIKVLYMKVLKYENTKLLNVWKYK